MKAIVYHAYGSPDVLTCEDVSRPTPEPNQVLIGVRAASVNPIDWHYMRGSPYLVRIPAGLFKPTITGLGVDVAGVVEAVGGKVTELKPGDAVFGTCHGSFAEYACASESTLAIKPPRATFEQAAAVPVAGLTALQALRDKGRVQAGQKVLVNGAAGGVGTFAVQIAKSLGADVTGVCSTRNVELVRSIGANEVIDYTQADFTTGGRRYDVLLDAIGNHSLSACRRILARKGVMVIVGGSGGRWLGPMGRLIKALVLSRFVGRRLVPMMANLRKSDLTVIGELIETGKVTPVIDRRYALREVPEAIRYLEEGHARGKVVITV